MECLVGLQHSREHTGIDAPNIGGRHVSEQRVADALQDKRRGFRTEHVMRIREGVWPTLSEKHPDAHYELTENARVVVRRIPPIRAKVKRGFRRFAIRYAVLFHDFALTPDATTETVPSGLEEDIAIG
jgi:hypothetical protein